MDGQQRSAAEYKRRMRTGEKAAGRKVLSSQDMREAPLKQESEVRAEKIQGVATRRCRKGIAQRGAAGDEGEGRREKGESPTGLVPTKEPRPLRELPVSSRAKFTPL